LVREKKKRRRKKVVVLYLLSERLRSLSWKGQAERRLIISPCSKKASPRSINSVGGQRQEAGNEKGLGRTKK